MDPFTLLSRCTGFQWDEGNVLKNWERHRVSAAECEEVFFNRPLIASVDERHSMKETRFVALGTSDSGRLIFIAFTVRDELIRVISARDACKKERKEFESS